MQNLKINYFLLLCFFLSILISCTNDAKKMLETSKKIQTDTLQYIHNADDFLGHPKVRTKEIYRAGLVIDTINWKKNPPFDSIIVKKRNNIFWIAYQDQGEIVLKYPNKSYEVCRTRIDSNGIKNNFIPFYNENGIDYFRLFIDNKNEVLINLNSNALAGINTTSSKYKYFSSFYKDTGIPEMLKLIHNNGEHNINISFYKNSKIKSIIYGKPFKPIKTYMFDESGVLSVQDGDNPSVIYNR